MFLRRQQPEANFEALPRATEPFESRGLRFRWIFDAARQFGADAAMEVVESARRCNSKATIAFELQRLADSTTSMAASAPNWRAASNIHRNRRPRLSNGSVARGRASKFASGCCLRKNITPMEMGTSA